MTVGGSVSFSRGVRCAGFFIHLANDVAALALAVAIILFILLSYCGTVAYLADEAIIHNVHRARLPWQKLFCTSVSL